MPVYTVIFDIKDLAKEMAYEVRAVKGKPKYAIDEPI